MQSKGVKRILRYLISFSIKQFDPIEVHRGAADRTFLDAVKKALGIGDLVCIFPQGTRLSANDLLDFNDGAATLSFLNRETPVVPVGISYLDQPRSIRVRIGEAFNCPDVPNGRRTREMIREYTHTMAAKVAALVEPQYRKKWDERHVAV